MLDKVSSLKWDQKQLLIPLSQSDSHIGKVKESHFLNFFDEIGDMPEYEPYSLAINKYNPLELKDDKNGTKNVNKNDEIF